MKTYLTCLLSLAVAASAATAGAQDGITVQLPTFSSFSVNTTVSVPDRGSAYMGGVKRAASGRNQFGTPLLPFGNRSFGTDRSASGSVSVFIHDFEAMDEYLLNQPTPSRRPHTPLAQPLAAYRKSATPGTDVLRRRPDHARRSSPLAGMSVAELRAERLREEDQRHQEALKWIERGRLAEAAGKPGVARVYYQNAIRGATGELQKQVAARLQALNATPLAPKLARNRP